MSSESSPTHLMVDPPSGWVYGFPKRMPADTRDVGQWLIGNGYPSEKVAFALSHLRMWASRQNEDEKMKSISDDYEGF